MTESATDPDQPPAGVLAAFGASAPLVPLTGGRGLTWRSGTIVLRPIEGDAEAEWKSAVLADVPTNDAFTVPRPLRAASGRWVHAGWQAMAWIPGAAAERRLADVIRAGAAFHDAIASQPRPSFIDDATDAWSVADRIAWDEAPGPDDALSAQLRAEYRPVSLPSQVIHGDLLGNVLFAPDRPPAIIDWAPYWRPAGFGAAVAAADAACWHGLPLEELRNDYGNAHWRQLLLRALIFRIATLQLNGYRNDAQVARLIPVARAVIALGE